VRDNAQLNMMIAGQTALGRVGLRDDIGARSRCCCRLRRVGSNGQRIEVAGGVLL